MYRTLWMFFFVCMSSIPTPPSLFCIWCMRVCLCQLCRNEIMAKLAICWDKFSSPWLVEAATGLICKYYNFICNCKQFRNNHCLWRVDTTKINCTINAISNYINRVVLSIGFPNATTGNESQIENRNQFAVRICFLIEIPTNRTQ